MCIKYPDKHPRVNRGSPCGPDLVSDSTACQWSMATSMACTAGVLHWNWNKLIGTGQTLSCLTTPLTLKWEGGYLCQTNSTRKVFLRLTTTVFRRHCFQFWLFMCALRFDQSAIIHFRSILAESLERLTNPCVYLGSLGYLYLYLHLSISRRKKTSPG